MQVYNYQTQPSHSPFIYSLVGFIVGMVVIGLTASQTKAIDRQLLSPIAQVVAAQIISPTPTPLPSRLKEVVEQALAGTTGTYGVYIRNLKTGEIYGRLEHHVFESASLYKLWVMATTYTAIEQKDIAEDDVLESSIENLNKSFDIDPQDAELTDGSIKLSVKDAMYQMITISHNYAAMLLSTNLQLPTIANFLTTQGLKESILGNPSTTTPADVGLFFEKLYHGELASAEHTKAMMDTLKDQQLNQKLPLHLPKEVAIAHKTGELDNVSHDAGIVFAPNGDYIIVVMSETDYPAGAEQRIADVSKAVYDYWDGK